MPTVEKAREQLMRARWDGTRCPCCDQYAKVYRRTITGTMACWLIWLVQSYRREPRWYHVRESFGNANPARKYHTGDYGKLLHWGLIVASEEEVEGKKSAGYWKPTRRGYRFVLGKISVERHAYVYNRECIELAGPMITITDALGTKFDYDKLMRGAL